jgi:hypothetical protein
MNDEFDLDIFDREFDELNNEMEVIYAQMDDAVEWMDILIDLESKVEQFNTNMQSIASSFPVILNKEHDNSFLIGTLLVGVISAYEGFIHDLFYICCNRSKYLNKALLCIGDLCDKDKNYLKVKVGVSEVNFKKMLLKATLHDPIQIARLSEKLFGLKMPTFNKEHTSRLLNIRNAFTHNNGFLNGTAIKLTKVEILNVHQAFIKLVNGYVNSIIKEANTHLEAV